MEETILIGRSDEIRSAPAAEWQKHLANAAPNIRRRLDFMTPQHHAVRNFVVTAIPQHRGKPIAPEEIAQQLKIDVERLSEILTELERHLFFLVRNGAGQVSWAFPVTTDRTAHRVRFETGERTFAA